MHMAQLMPLPLTVSCSSKIQIGFTFLVPAYPGCPRKEAVKWLLLLLLLLCLLAEYLTLSTDRELISWLWVNSDESKTSCETKPESCDEILDSCRTQDDSCKHKNTGNVVSELCSVLQLLLKHSKDSSSRKQKTKAGNILLLNVSTTIKCACSTVTQESNRYLENSVKYFNYWPIKVVAVFTESKGNILFDYCSKDSTQHRPK